MPSRVQDTADRSASLGCCTSLRPRSSADMNHLAYDDEDENLTVVTKSDAETTFCETKLNSVLIKMLSPWWRAKLTFGGFKDSVQDSRCVIVHENPRVAELALDAAKFRLRQADLVAEGDLNLAYTTWQLADM